MKLSEDLVWRGLIKDKTFTNIKWLDKPQTFYHGIDASADSITIGNLAAMLLARRLIDAGWQAVLLAGGATSLIGDPKETEERELKPREEIEKNVEAVKTQIQQLFAGKDFISVDNYDWFKEVGYLDFLREVGKNFAISELMQREFITERLSSGISYAEFSYSLIQGYDYWQLYKKHETILQIGGSDQWGNMLSGVSLIRKKEAQEVHALSMPLVVDKTTGRKFGKSETGAIWLDASKTSVYKFYQFWYNSGDEDVTDYLKVFTLLSRNEIETLASQQKQNPADRPAQKRLAFEVTAIVHGPDQAKKQEHIAQALLAGGDVSTLNEAEIATVREELPSKKIQPGSSVMEVLVDTGLAASNSEARRLMESKSIYANNQKFNKPHLDAVDFKNNRLMLRRGKAYKDSALVELI
ncbi:tyrosine--tRNA ligase [Candidatus Saccharibacteria bacterium]|nr:tyrosine--tRNA ligase [Candidatus Saccharibacteria bacterium]